MNSNEREFREKLDNLTQNTNQKSNYLQYQHFGVCNNPCLKCGSYYKRVFETGQEIKLPLHPNCDCYYSDVPTIPLGTISKLGLNSPDVWLKLFGKLPDYYITKEKAINDYGWNNSKNTIAGKAPGKMIGGDIYHNKKGYLPSKSGRIWYECDIDYFEGRRNSARLYYSSDGLKFYSPDHLFGDVTVYLVK